MSEMNIKNFKIENAHMISDTTCFSNSRFDTSRKMRLHLKKKGKIINF